MKQLIMHYDERIDILPSRVMSRAIPVLNMISIRAISPEDAEIMKLTLSYYESCIITCPINIL